MDCQVQQQGSKKVKPTTRVVITQMAYFIFADAHFPRVGFEFGANFLRRPRNSYSHLERWIESLTFMASAHCQTNDKQAKWILSIPHRMQRLLGPAAVTVTTNTKKKVRPSRQRRMCLHSVTNPVNMLLHDFRHIVNVVLPLLSH